jgi:hypothetical protein
MDKFVVRSSRNSVHANQSKDLVGLLVVKKENGEIMYILKLLRFMDKKLGGSESSFLPKKCTSTRLYTFAISKFFRAYISDPRQNREGMRWDSIGGREMRGMEERGGETLGMGRMKLRA